MDVQRNPFRFPHCLIAMVIAFAIAPSPRAHAADDVGTANWPRFRGPNGSGVSEDVIPVKWTEKDFAWKTELPGEGHSSPIVWGNDVFVTAADEDEGKRYVVCLSATNGKIRWTAEDEFKTYHKHGENSFASSTPAVDAKHVYLEWTTQDTFSVVAIDRSGKQKWRKELGKYKTQHGGGGSPMVHGGLVIVNVDQDKPESFVAALDCETGDVRWRTPRNSTQFSASTPCVYRGGAGGGGREQIVFATNANGIAALDPSDGRVVWELPGVFNARVVSSPFCTGDLVFGACGEGGRGRYVVAVNPPDQESEKPEVAYRLNEETPYVPTSIVYRDRLFTWGDAGTVACYDVATGEQHWTGKIKGTGYFGSPVCAGGKLYCISKRGEMAVVDATADEFKLLARNPLGEASDATPAIANGKMFVRTLTHLICVRGASANQADNDNRATRR
jgi:outer membrane protein assembly factor BamB